jgi:hypothetical protein
MDSHLVKTVVHAMELLGESLRDVLGKILIQKMWSKEKNPPRKKSADQQQEQASPPSI